MNTWYGRSLVFVAIAKLMFVDGIPKSFVYDREGKLVAQAIDIYFSTHVAGTRAGAN